MKTAQVYSMPAETAHGVVWKWRSDDRTRRSLMAFVDHDQCVADAKKSGYSVAVAQDPAG